MTFFQQYHFEWWQILILIVAFRTYPLFLALATILVARFVKPEIARIALPLILARRNTWVSPMIRQRLNSLMRQPNFSATEKSRKLVRGAQSRFFAARSLLRRMAGLIVSVCSV